MTRLPLATMIVAGLLAGCAAAPSRPLPPGAPAAPQGADRTEADMRPGSAVPGASPAPSPVTIALLSQSNAQRDAGDLDGAAATIERALTISPDDALLWVELAEIRLRAGDVDLAEEMARKALTLTDANSSLAGRARRLIRR